MYHSIGLNSKFSTVTPENFKKQLSLLNKSGYKVISLSEMILRIKDKADLRGCVALTFDDGYEDFYIHAYPLLTQYHFPATVFVPTAFIGATLRVSQGRDEFAVMTSDQLKEISKDGLIEVMPHTVNHSKLTKMVMPDAIKEIEDSRSALERITEKDAPILAYPSGKYTIEIVEYLGNSVSWLASVTVNPGLVGHESDVFVLQRNSIDSSVGLLQFRMKVSDAVALYIKIRKWIKS